MEPTYFKSPSEWRQWLAEHQADESELLVGFYKKNSGKPSITWPEAVDEALCFGWIDGVRKNLDETSYTIRFTPRKPRSIWSSINSRRAEALIEMGRMQPAGLKAFQARSQARSGIYSYEQQERPGLTEEYKAQFQKNEKAWTYFQSRPPGYQRTVSWWVMSAKREETKLKRLAELIDSSEQERIIDFLTFRPKEK
jgi:uncharacterized protein YdeI (YjbR/CyaY-like superfamily)